MATKRAKTSARPAGRNRRAKPARRQTTTAVRKAAVRTAKAPSGTLLLIATRKGAWIFHGDAARKTWRADGPHFLGQIVNHLVLDPRDGRTLLAATSTGHLGPTLHRSTDLGRTWREAERPPAFAKAPEGQAGRSVKHTFWLTPGHPSQPNVWYAGTSPQGLFRSEDAGDHWEPFGAINDDPQYRSWMGREQDGTPDGPKLHSVTIDPRDPMHMYLGMSGGGVHESHDGGRNWSPLAKGLEVVEGFNPADMTFHDPHCIRICPSNPDRLYQQNHCGIYRIDRPSDEWVRIGRNMPVRIGDIGFPMVVHPRDDRAVWVFPMDGGSVWPRTSPAGKPCVYRTRNAGKTWQRLDQGLPQSQAWWTVKRQAMTADHHDPVGLYFGTTGGDVWLSRDEGASWSYVARHLPEIYAIEAAMTG
jgi:photosystem II stability/assembly factor-like uncharacterized protein